QGFTVVCPDLLGYGRSAKPHPAPDHRPHAKRSSALEVVGVMRTLGHERFAVVGHDRGSYVGLRLCLDHPERVAAATLVDCIPVSEHLRRCDARFATAWWHWFFFAQPDVPERVILADPGAWYRGDPAVMGAENHAEFRSATADPTVVTGMLEDYRAGLTVDRADEEADRTAGRRVSCPLQVLWSERDDLEELYGDPRAIWRDWAVDVEGHGIDSGHHVAEEAPDQLADAVAGFLHRRLPASTRRTGEPPPGYARYLAACNRRDWGEVVRLVADPVVVNGVARTPTGYADDLRALVAVFPDYRWTVRRCVVEGDRLAVHLEDRGTRRATFEDAPGDGTVVTTDEFAMYRFDAAGLIAEVEVAADSLRLTR
ncbi:MAG: alpha/beta fold hydrolase, partial [Phycicoccus sp.]